MQLPILLLTLPLLALADKSCSLYPGLSYGNCRSCASTDCSVVHRWEPGTIIGVRCIDPNGQSVNGNTVWDWVPGWGCWVSADITNNGCECKA